MECKFGGVISMWNVVCRVISVWNVVCRVISVWSVVVYISVYIILRV